MCQMTTWAKIGDNKIMITKNKQSNEINLMRAEVSAMRLVSDNCSFKVADVQYYDCSQFLYFLCRK